DAEGDRGSFRGHPFSTQPAFTRLLMLGEVHAQVPGFSGAGQLRQLGVGGAGSFLERHQSQSQLSGELGEKLGIDHCSVGAMRVFHASNPMTPTVYYAWRICSPA